MVIFKGERFNHEWTHGEFAGTLYRTSEQGWIDQELLYLWFNKLFLASIPLARPVLLLLDGHSTHYTPEVTQSAASKGVIIVCLPPPTTHAAQPLDVSFFGALKSHWSSLCHSYLADNLGRVITKFQFSALFSQAWIKAVKAETIISGFHKTGICLLIARSLPYRHHHLNRKPRPRIHPNECKTSLRASHSIAL